MIDYVFLGFVIGFIVVFGWHELSRSPIDANFGLSLLRKRLSQTGPSEKSLFSRE